MSAAKPTVIVVDDDVSVREALAGLLQSVGIEVKLYGSVQEFLAATRPGGSCCIVLDVRLPGQSGLDLQDHLAKANTPMPIVFITGHGDIPMTVRAMKAGAVEFLTKPFRDQELLDAIHAALERDDIRRGKEAAIDELRQRFELLTPRERKVMAYVVTGCLNKQIAGTLGISEITVKAHRSRVMHKMMAASLADLVRMADTLEISPGTV